MPKEYQQRVEALPQLTPVSQPQDLRVAARPVDQTVTPERGDNLLGELVGGLAAISPQLQQYVQQKNTTDANAAYDAGQAVANRDTESILDPNKAILAADAMPDTVEPAFKNQFEKGYREIIGQRHASKLQDDLLKAWDGVRMDESTDHEKFLRSWVQENTAGFSDPLMLDPISKSLTATAKSIRADARQIAFKRLEVTTREGIGSLFGGITNDMSVDQMMGDFYNRIVPQALKTGFVTRSELAGMLLDRVNALSLAMNGRPELFDMLKEFKDPATGLTLAASNPKVAEAIEVQRAQADAQVERHLERAQQPLNFAKKNSLLTRAQQGSVPSAAEIQAEIGPRGMFSSDEQALSFMHQLYKVADEARGAQHALALAQGGQLAALKPEEQTKVMDRLTDPLVGALFTAGAQPGGEATFNQAVSQLVHQHQQAGASVANSRLKNLFGTVKQAMPAKGAAPTPMFTSLANIYSQLPANLQSAYVPDEDTRLILSRYREARAGGVSTQVDEATAYAQAYASVTPEAKEAGKRMLGTPEGRAKVKETIDNLTAVVGWRAFLGFETLGTYPTNEDVVTDRVQAAARSYIERMGGNVSESEALSWGKQWFTERFVYEKASNNYVEVPPNQANERTAEALSEYMERTRAQYGKDAQPRLVHLGNGTYQVQAAGVAGSVLAHGVTLGEMQDAYKAKRLLSPDEGKQMVTLQRALLDGSVTAEQIEANSTLLSKARTLDVWDREMWGKVDAARTKAFKESMSPILKNVPKASLDGVDQSRLPSNGNSMKAEIAKSYWDRGQYGKSLTVLAEGVVLQRYEGLAAGEGGNIGMAYNLKANAGHIKEDFRRAGIPAEVTEDVVAGRKALTREQAMRLFDVSYARYESGAAAEIDKLYGKGTWAKLPANRQAVLTDVVYQSGNISQFKQTLDGFINEVGSLDTQNPRVHFRDRNTGQMRPDTGRNNMRLNMLNGMSSFQAVIDRVASQPRNRMEAVALKPQ